MSKKIKENIFDSAKKFTDAFFDGLKNNAIDKVLQKAQEHGAPHPLIQKMKDLEKEKKELDALIKKYSK